MANVLDSKQVWTPITLSCSLWTYTLGKGMNLLIHTIYGLNSTTTVLLQGRFWQEHHSTVIFSNHLTEGRKKERKKERKTDRHWTGTYFGQSCCICIWQLRPTLLRSQRAIPQALSCSSSAWLSPGTWGTPFLEEYWWGQDIFWVARSGGNSPAPGSHTKKGLVLHMAYVGHQANTRSYIGLQPVLLLFAN